MSRVQSRRARVAALRNLQLSNSECADNGMVSNLRIKARNRTVQARRETSYRTVGRLWTRRRTGLFSKGALIDVRVSDVRETWNVKDGPALKTRIVPLSQLYVFLILPSGLKHQFSSPAFRHVRILEGAAWEMANQSREASTVAL